MNLRQCARSRRRLAVRPQHFQEPPVFGHERKVEDIIGKGQYADRRSKLDGATVNTLKLLRGSVASMRARYQAPDVVAGNLTGGFEDNSDPELGVLPYALLGHAH
jgi:hypothetical protein